jgi:hypothetical protein
MGREIRRTPINSSGVAEFKNIPQNILNDSIKLTIELQGWQFTNQQNSIKKMVLNEMTEIVVERDETFRKIIGSITNEKFQPIENVIVSVENIVAHTDTNGWFEINIPEQQFKPEYILKAKKKGYIISENHVVPFSKTEIQIILHQ